ncbi:MAG: AraC family transcriptional regulator [Pseudoclavibacter sp.]
MSLTEVAQIVRSRGTTVLQRTVEVDAVIDACSTAIRPHTLQVREAGLAVQLDHLPSAVGLTRLQYGAEVTISEITPEQDEFIISLPVAGRARFDTGRRTAILQPGTMSIVSPYQGFRLDIGRDFDQVLFRLDRRRVERVAAMLVGAVEPTPVHFELFSARYESGLVGLLNSVVQLAIDTNLSRFSRLDLQLEMLIIDALLLGYPSNLSAQLTLPVGSASAERVSRAMDYMTARLAEPFPLSEAARHCGVSLRSLQQGFRREVGASPGEWLRDRRLDHAYAQLSIADAGETTVSAVVFGSGFQHLGDFAARFKKRFGVSPSSVLRTARN